MDQEYIDKVYFYFEIVLNSNFQVSSAVFIGLYAGGNAGWSRFLMVTSNLLDSRWFDENGYIVSNIRFRNFFSSDGLIAGSSGTVCSFSTSAWFSSVSSTFVRLRFFRI